MWYVYLLRSQTKRILYTGFTKDLRRRLFQHNYKMSLSTKAGAPWNLEAYIAVKDEQVARAPEKYFKTGSGKAVLKKRILSDETSQPHSTKLPKGA